MILSHAPSIHIHIYNSKEFTILFPIAAKYWSQNTTLITNNNRDIPKDYKPREQQIPGTSYSAVCESELEKNEME